MNFRQLDNAVARLISPLKRKVSLMVGRAILNAIDDSKKVQSVKLDGLPDEVAEDIERFQNYGFTSVPFKGCEAIVVFHGGRRSHGTVVATDDRDKRPKDLAEGDSAMYNSNGVRVLAQESSDQVHLGNAPTDFVALTTPTDAEFTAVKADLDALKILLATHVHPGVTVGFASTAVSPAFVGYTPHTPASVSAAEVKAK